MDSRRRGVLVRRCEGKEPSFPPGEQKSTGIENHFGDMLWNRLTVGAILYLF